MIPADHDFATDEEATAADLPPREDLLATAALQGARKLGSLSVRKITAETLSYLFQVENFFIKGIKGDRVSASNANAIWATAEFVYIHAGDPEEVAESIWYPLEFRNNVRKTLSGPLNDPKLLAEALPIIEHSVAEYFAAQSEVQAQPGRTKLAKPGKAQARHGKPRI
jgi:hypothetical protein